MEHYYLNAALIHSEVTNYGNENGRMQYLKDVLEWKCYWEQVQMSQSQSSPHPNGFNPLCRQYHINIRPNGSGAGASAGLGAAAAAPGATAAATAANASQQQQQQQHIQAMTAAALTAGLPTVTAPGMLPGFRGQPPFATNPAAAQANQAAQQAHALAQAQQQQLFLQQLMKSYPSHNGSV